MTSLHRQKQFSRVVLSALPGGGRVDGDAGFPFPQRQSATCADDIRDMLAELTAQIKRRWDCNNLQCAPEVMR